MDIERIGKPTPAAGIPIISFAAIHGGIVYLCGITANPAGPLGDVKQQTREVLEQLDAALRAAGTDKSRLLTAQVWLTDMDTSPTTTTPGMSGSIQSIRRFVHACNHLGCGGRACGSRSW